MRCSTALVPTRFSTPSSTAAPALAVSRSPPPSVGRRPASSLSSVASRWPPCCGSAWPRRVCRGGSKSLSMTFATSWRRSADAPCSSATRLMCGTTRSSRSGKPGTRRAWPRWAFAPRSSPGCTRTSCFMPCASCGPVTPCVSSPRRNGSTTATATRCGGCARDALDLRCAACGWPMPTIPSSTTRWCRPPWCWSRAASVRAMCVWARSPATVCTTCAARRWCNCANRCAGQRTARPQGQRVRWASKSASCFA